MCTFVYRHKMSSLCLVTGGKGLVGSGIKMALEDTDLHKWFNVCNEFFYLDSSHGDLTEYENVLKCFKKYRPKYVIHLAAKVGGLFKNMRENLSMFRDNMLINDNVLKACYEFKVVKVISCLSTCIFPDKTIYPIDETMIHNGPPHSSNYGYSYAKRMLEVLSRGYTDATNGSQCFTCIIPCNIYGPYDNFSLEDGHIIPALIHKAYNLKYRNIEFKVLGTGKPLRQFIFNKDLGVIILKILQDYHSTEAICCSSDAKDEESIKDVAQMIFTAFKLENPIEFETSFADGQFKKTASNFKLRQLLPDFKFTPISEGINQTVNWFIENYQNARK